MTLTVNIPLLLVPLESTVETKVKICGLVIVSGEYSSMTTNVCPIILPAETNCCGAESVFTSVFVLLLDTKFVTFRETRKGVSCLIVSLNAGFVNLTEGYEESQ